MELKQWHKRLIKWSLIAIIILFLVINLIVGIQAYKFTHFTNSASTEIKDSTVSKFDIVKAIFTGVDIPRPETKRFPILPYESIQIPAGTNKSLDAWIIRAKIKSKGMILLFHGYMDEKSFLLDYAYEFIDMGYDVLLTDFMGSGGSYGNQSTIGYIESENVRSTFIYAKMQLKEERVFMMGFSMGAAAILKAQHEYGLPTNGIIAEASYGKLFDTIKVRARMIGLGPFSNFTTYLFSFWMGVTNTINPFEMNPEEYAHTILVPTLIACGGKDQFIPMKETQRIFDNLSSTHKALKFYPECTHEPYNKKYPKEWKETVSSFLNSIK